MTEETRVTKHFEVPEHVPGLYRFDQVADSVATLDDIGEVELARFHEQGFLVVRQAFTPDEIDDAVDGLMDCIAGRNKGFELNLEAGVEDWEKAASLDERLRRVRKLYRFCEGEPRLAAIAEHPKLHGLLTRLMGEPATMWSDQALLKPPLIGTEKPWHQDLAYFNLPPETLVVGCWIALDEATAENGCMHLIPGSHRRGPTVHFRIRDWQLCDRDVPVEQDVMAPLPPGGALIFHGLLWHGTPPNRSERTRRALQLHYYPAGVERCAPEERLAVFGSEGKDVSC